MSQRRRGPGPDVKFPPPLLFVAGVVAGWLLDRYAMESWPAIGERAADIGDVVAVAVIVAGLSLAFWGIATFNRRRTAVYPNRDASALVMEGPYQFTRNPMYTGMTGAYLGVSWLARTLWPVLLLPLVLYALYRLVIRREERHLTEAFGEAYLEYQSRVGRWFRR